MSERTIVVDIDDPQTSVEQPTPALRWLASRDLPKRLQQRWCITKYDSNGPVGTHLEWRDVPTEAR